MFTNSLVKILTIFALLQIGQIDCARILGIAPPPAPSHHILISKLMKELALKGHEVTLISPFNQKKPMKNYKDVILPTNFEALEEFKKESMEATSRQNPISAMSRMIPMLTEISENTFSAPSVQELLKSNQKFDLVIMETFLNEAHVAFAHHYNAPLVLVSTIPSNAFVNHYTQNPEPPSYCAQTLGGMAGKMSFVERLINTILSGFMEVVMNFIHIPLQENLVQKYFPGYPSIKQIVRERLSIVLMNSHSSINVPKPLVPNMIEIGGYHVEEPKELPKDLKEYLDNAKEGFILCSLGSNFKSAYLSEQRRNAFLKTFEKLPYKILWKFEDDSLQGKPNNVKISKWLPQNDILAHPNLKLFITHGGLLSTTEAIYHGVPFVGIPILGDQQINMKTAESLGIGRKVDLYQLNADDLLKQVQEVINNPKYAKEAKARSKLMHDQPMKPIDTAMFWIEYALRHKNTDHLKTIAADLQFWEVMNIDVLAVLGLAAILTLYINYWIIKKICSCFCGKQKTQSKDKKKRE